MRCVRCGWPSKNYEMSNDGRPVRAPRRRLPARSARCRRAPRLRGAPGHLPTVPGGPGRDLRDPVAAGRTGRVRLRRTARGGGAPPLPDCGSLVRPAARSPAPAYADLRSRSEETGLGESGKVAGVVDAMDGGKSAAVPLDLVNAGGAEI